MGFADKKMKTASKRVALSQKTPSQPKKHARKKLSATVFALILDSLLVLSAAAYAGTSYYKAIRSNRAETLLPRATTIGASAQTEDILLTLHESVSDGYTTAYLFSLKGLTDAGKSFVKAGTPDPDTCQTSLIQTNAEERIAETLKTVDSKTSPAVVTPPPENTDCQLYEWRQQSLSNESDLNIGLRRDGVARNAINSAVYQICPVKSLCDETCAYYALYIIGEEPQQLSLTFAGLILSLPEAMMPICGTVINLGGCIRDYYLNEGGLTTLTDEMPADAVVSPLGLYVNAGNLENSFFEDAKLTFTDGSEIDLKKALLEENDYRASYYSADDTITVCLFKDPVGLSTVKSMVLCGDIEFPIDGKKPVARSNGRKLDPSSDHTILWTAARRLREYIADACPVSVTYRDDSTSKTITKNAWSDIKYAGQNTLCFDVIGDSAVDKTDRFFVSLTDISGLTLEQEARAMVETYNAELRTADSSQTLPFNIIKTGTFIGTELIAADCGETVPGYTRRCIFAIYNNQLLTIRFDSCNGTEIDDAFDNLLELF